MRRKRISRRASRRLFSRTAQRTARANVLKFSRRGGISM